MLNRQGILQLADDLIADSSKYDQNYWGSHFEDQSACGTVACLAGFCMSRAIGVTKFNELAKVAFGVDGSAARGFGGAQLGIPRNAGIFHQADLWPSDLYREYQMNSEAKSRVVVALKALQRLRDDGSIDVNPNAVHTFIPQLLVLQEPLEEPSVSIVDEVCELELMSV